MIATEELTASEAAGGDTMKAIKSIASIFALPVMLTVKMCELIFAAPVKAVMKNTRR